MVACHGDRHTALGCLVAENESRGHDRPLGSNLAFVVNHSSPSASLNMTLLGAH